MSLLAQRPVDVYAVRTERPGRDGEREDEFDLAPPPGLHTLQRTSSSPSSFSSSTVVASPQLGSGDIAVVKDVQEDDEESETITAIETGSQNRRVRTSISMDGLNNGNPMAFNRNNMRSRSGSNPTPVVMPRPAARHQTTQPRPIISANPSTMSRSSRADAPKSSGGFAAFLRRLTGRSSSPSSKGKSKDAKKTAAVAPAASTSTSAPTPRPTAPMSMQRSASASGRDDAQAARSARPTLNIAMPSPNVSRTGPLTAPAAPQAGRILPGPTPQSPQSPQYVSKRADSARPTDPCQIPLPPSPLAAPLPITALSSEEPSELLLSPMSPTTPSMSGAPPIIRRTQPSGMLSLEEFEEEEEEATGNTTDEASESDDMVRDLRPIRIPSSGARSSTSSAVGPATPASATSTYDELVTPTSVNGSPPTFEKRLATSPQISKAGGGELGRKGSKWRQSMMGLSDHLNPKSVSRKQSTKVPPSSYDAYEAHQRRIANNRASCAPTMHSTATIATELREIKDKEESDRAETFFLS